MLSSFYFMARLFSRASIQAWLPVLRQVLVSVILALMVLYSKVLPPIIILAFLLGILHIVLNYKQIPFRQYWPFLITIGYYLMALLWLPGTENPHWGQMATMMRIVLVLAPVVLIDLKPARHWGTMLIVAPILLLIISLGVALYYSLSVENGVWTFTPYRPESLEFFGGSVWKTLQSSSNFAYTGLTFHVGHRPALFGFSMLVGLLVAGHRLLSSRAYRGLWYYWAALPVLFLGLLLSASRTNIVVLSVCLVCILLYYIIRVRGYWGWKIGAVALLPILLLLFFFTFRLSFYNTSALGEYVQRDARVRLWTGVWEFRDEFLPWGVGTGAERNMVELSAQKNNPVALGLNQMHCEAYSALVEMGYPGAIYYLAMMLIPLIFYRNVPPLHRLLIVALLFYSIFESFSPVARGVAYLAFFYNMAWLYGIKLPEGFGLPRRSQL